MPKPQYDDELRGVLFPNDRKVSDEHADLTGSVTVQGVAYFCDAWRRVSTRDGTKFLSLRLKPKGRAPDAKPRSAAPGSADESEPF